VKILRKEIDRRIEYAAHVRHEPVVATPGGQPESSGDLRYRMVAVDKLVELDTLVADYDSEYFRPAWTNVRSFLVECLGKGKEEN
jgi:NICE-3 protein